MSSAQFGLLLDCVIVHDILFLRLFKCAKGRKDPDNSALSTQYPLPFFYQFPAKYEAHQNFYNL